MYDKDKQKNISYATERAQNVENYEPKLVTVREAQILGKPVVITRFPTSSSQLEEGVDGIIVPNSVEGAAAALADFIKDRKKQQAIHAYLHTHHYGNEEEVNKLYDVL